jgi:arginine deiminase
MPASAFLDIRSEIDPIQTILLHRPGGELEQLMPKYLDEMLFEDIPYLEQMQLEHDEFASRLRERGAEVLYFEQLLAESLGSNIGGKASRNQIVDAVLNELRVNSSSLKQEIRELLLDRGDADLARTLISGLTKTEIPHKGSEKRLSFYIKESYPFYLDPLPNLYFSRDYGTVIGKRMSVNTMKARARQRESMLLEYIAEHHPRFAAHPGELWHHHDERDSIEGGDILILSDEVVAIGCSARTSPEAIEELASDYFPRTSRSAGYWSCKSPSPGRICIWIRCSPWWTGTSSPSSPESRITLHSSR